MLGFLLITVTNQLSPHGLTGEAIELLWLELVLVSCELPANVTVARRAGGNGPGITETEWAWLNILSYSFTHTTVALLKGNILCYSFTHTTVALLKGNNTLHSYWNSHMLPSKSQKLGIGSQ